MASRPSSMVISLGINSPLRKPSTSTLAVLNDRPRSLRIHQPTITTNTSIFAASSAAKMHLSAVHNSVYYSGPSSATNMTTSSAPCFNMTIGSRIMRHCRPCTTNLNGTNATSIFARNVDSRESQSSHTMVIIGIIVAIAIGCLCVATTIGYSVKSNRKAFAKSQGRRGRVVRHGNGSFSEKDDIEARGHACIGDGGLDAPPRTARSNSRRFPVRVQSKHSGSGRPNQSRGPYQD